MIRSEDSLKLPQVMGKYCKKSQGKKGDGKPCQELHEQGL